MLCSLLKIRESLETNNLNGYYDSNIVSIGVGIRVQRHLDDSISVSTLLVYKDSKTVDQENLKYKILNALKSSRIPYINLIPDSVTIKQQECNSYENGHIKISLN